MKNDTWGRVKQQLLESVGRNNFANWIEPLELTKVDNGVAVFSVPTSFMANWVSRNFADTILTHLKAANAPASRVEFKVAAHQPQPASSEPKPAAAPVVVPVEPAELPGAPLDARFTFDNFVVGKPNELAHAAARRVAEGGPVTFNPLFLYGGVGLGKTHLMHAIAHETRTRNPELRVLYLSAEQFMYRFVQALRDRQMIDFKQIFRSVDVLMVDDVQFIAGKDSTQEEFFHTFNALVDQGKTGSNRVCNAALWSICTRPITNCVSVFFKPKPKPTGRNIRAFSLLMVCWNFWPIVFRPTCVCWRGL